MEGSRRAAVGGMLLVSWAVKMEEDRVSMTGRFDEDWKLAHPAR
jgi:hypothetical protein